MTGPTLNSDYAGAAANPADDPRFTETQQSDDSRYFLVEETGDAKKRYIYFSMDDLSRINGVKALDFKAITGRTADVPLPKDIWASHIIPFLGTEALKLREVCSFFNKLGFTSTFQRAWLNKYFMPTTQAQVDALSSLLTSLSLDGTPDYSLINWHGRVQERLIIRRNGPIKVTRKIEFIEQMGYILNLSKMQLSKAPIRKIHSKDLTKWVIRDKENRGLTLTKNGNVLKNIKSGKMPFSIERSPGPINEVELNIIAVLFLSLLPALMLSLAAMSHEQSPQVNGKTDALSEKQEPQTYKDSWEILDDDHELTEHEFTEFCFIFVIFIALTLIKVICHNNFNNYRDFYD